MGGYDVKECLVKVFQVVLSNVLALLKIVDVRITISRSNEWNILLHKVPWILSNSNNMELK